MIDIHAHYFPNAKIYSKQFLKESGRMRSTSIELVTDYRHYRATASGVRKTVVFGGKARRAGLWVPDDVVARFVHTDPTRFLGFMALDLAEAGWEDELRRGHLELGLRGVKLMPMYAGFYPNARRFDGFWSYVCEHRLPVLLHTGTTFVSNAPLDTTRPVHLDDVAIRYPEARMVLAHLGHPYEGECLAVIRKHEHVYADLSALFYRPFQLFHSLMLAQEYGVTHKILLGSDYPISTIDDTVRGLRSLLTRDLGGFRLDPALIEAIIARNSLCLLGLESDPAESSL
jgi:predicted TIM-barrel fold metal-dependent hydrolase